MTALHPTREAGNLVSPGMFWATKLPSRVSPNLSTSQVRLLSVSAERVTRLPPRITTSTVPAFTFSTTVAAKSIRGAINLIGRTVHDGSFAQCALVLLLVSMLTVLGAPSTISIASAPYSAAGFGPRPPTASKNVLSVRRILSNCNPKRLKFKEGNDVHVKLATPLPNPSCTFRTSQELVRSNWSISCVHVDGPRRIAATGSIIPPQA
mmetsp:Transcript_5625/g.9076  ORF Transcript_5625/g.9076 Transcript_5625/m.9076 type:complete len:208 (+) Transcript_5625:442-1065(+)